MDTLLLTVPDTGSPGWDLALDANNNIAVTTGAYAIAQDAASAIKTVQGECYYDTTLGIPWNANYLGRIPAWQLLKSAMRNAAMSVPGVVSAVVYFTGFANRKLSGQVQITDNTGASGAVNF